MKIKFIFQVSLFISVLLLPLQMSSQINRKEKKSKQFAQEFSQKLKDSIPSIGSFIVSKNGETIFEEYFNGATKETTFDVKSVTKSVTSILAGIAKDKGYLTDLNTPVLNILREYDISRTQFKNTYDIEGKMHMDSTKRTLTLQHLLTMKGGFKWKENSSEIASAYFYSSDPVRFVFDLPFEEYPGDQFNYNTGETQVFGAALSHLVHSSLKDFADKNLFEPLSLKVERWDTDVLNRNLAGSELFMKPSDMLAFGKLILNKGKVGNKQIVSEEWIKESTSKKVHFDFWDVLPNANGYGYYWWLRTSNGFKAIVAVGYGGQLICIIPELKTVVVATCFLNEKNRGRSELKLLHNFIDQVKYL